MRMFHSSKYILYRQSGTAVHDSVHQMDVHNDASAD